MIFCFVQLRFVLFCLLEWNTKLRSQGGNLLSKYNLPHPSGIYFMFQITPPPHTHTSIKMTNGWGTDHTTMKLLPATQQDLNKTSAIFSLSLSQSSNNLQNDWSRFGHSARPSWCQSLWYLSRNSFPGPSISGFRGEGKWSLEAPKSSRIWDAVELILDTFKACHIFVPRELKSLGVAIDL